MVPFTERQRAEARFHVPDLQGTIRLNLHVEQVPVIGVRSGISQTAYFDISSLSRETEPVPEAVSRTFLKGDHAVTGSDCKSDSVRELT